MARSRRHFTDEFKREMVRLATQPDSNVSRVAQGLGWDPSVPRRWVGQMCGGGGTGQTQDVLDRASCGASSPSSWRPAMNASYDWTHGYKCNSSTSIHRPLAGGYGQ